MKKYRLALFFTFSLFCLSSRGQQFPITQITTASTNCLLRDHDGFVWFGTQDGLVRYDGNEFRNFRHHRGDATSIPNNFIWCLEQDSKHRLWIGTFGGGLAMYNKYKERFSTYYIDLPGSDAVQENTIRALEIVGDTMLLIGTEKGIRGFDLRNLKFYAGGVWDSLANLDWFVYSIAINPSGEVYVGTERGLYGIYDMMGEVCIQQMALPDDDEQTIPHVLVHKGIMYVGSENGLLISMDFLHFENHFQAYRQKPHRVQQIYIDRHENIWLATLEGLGHFHEDQGYQWYHPNPMHPRTLKTDIIQCVGEAEKDIVFAGTLLGVHQFSSVAPPFHNLAYLNDRVGCSRTALGMVEDHRGDIWICKRSGLMRMTIGRGDEIDAVCYLPENTPGMLHDYTINITRDLRDDLWLTYRYGGFSRIRIVGDSLEWYQYPKTVARFEGGGVNQIYQDSRRNYWIATRGLGLMQFFPEKDSVVVYNATHGLSHPYIFRIYEDFDHHLWIATASGGLCAFDRDTKRFTCFLADRRDPTSISSNMIIALSEDSENRLWVCTYDGLNLMDKESGTFTVFTTADGLPNNVIYAALEDRRRDIWISTNAGIARMQYKDSIATFVVFDERHGLPGPEFNQHAYLRHSSGVLLMGSSDGVVYWKPEDIQAREYAPKIVLTEFQLNREPAQVAKKLDKNLFSLDTNINDTRRLVLKYHQNFLSFKFSALAYDHSKIGSYRFMMEGVDNHWVMSGDRKYAIYPDLKPGHYALKVNVTNSAGIPGGPPKVVDITILPPPWKSWWAYTLYGIIIIASLYGVLLAHLARNRAIEKVREAERDMFRKRLARDFHDEAGNKITLLSLLADRAKKKSDNPEVKEILVNLQDYIQDLRAGMRDFIWIMDPSHDSAFDTVVRFRDFADKVCEQAGVEFEEHGRHEELKEVKMAGNVRRHMLLIFKEAMYNSLKHAHPDKISFSSRKNSPENWEFILEDDGSGFNTRQPSEGHGLSNMRARATQINADIEITQRNGSGTRVSLKWKPAEYE